MSETTTTYAAGDILTLYRYSWNAMKFKYVIAEIQVTLYAREDGTLYFEDLISTGENIGVERIDEIPGNMHAPIFLSKRDDETVLSSWRSVIEKRIESYQTNIETQQAYLNALVASTESVAE